MSQLGYSFGAVGVGVFAWVLVAAWIRVSLRIRILDVPNERSSHTRVTPRGGGVGIVTAVLAAMGIAAVLGQLEGGRALLWVAGLALFIAVISFVDDVRSLPSLVRLFCQVGAAVAAVAIMGRFPVITFPWFGAVVLPAWVMGALTVVWIVGLTNVYNFMDGIDGIAGAQAVVAGLAWAWFGRAAGVPFVVFAGVILAVSSIGFLVHNWSPARVFMGDVGSAFLGFCFAILPLMALAGRNPETDWQMELIGSVPVFAAFVVWPFLGDGVFTFVRRLKHRQNVLAAHRSHLYQRLTIAGWPHARVARLYFWWGVLSVMCGALYLRTPDPARVAAVAVAVLSLLGMYVLVKKAERAAMEQSVEG